MQERCCFYYIFLGNWPSNLQYSLWPQITLCLFSGLRSYWVTLNCSYWVTLKHILLHHSEKSPEFKFGPHYFHRDLKNKCHQLLRHTIGSLGIPVGYLIDGVVTLSTFGHDARGTTKLFGVFDLQNFTITANRTQPEDEIRAACFIFEKVHPDSPSTHLQQQVNAMDQQ